MPAGQNPQIRVVQAHDLAPQRRALRRPAHDFNIKHRPYSITPFFIAPVLPGETLTNLLYQARAVSDPIQNPIIGWWLEHYFFYVPWRGMPDFQATLKAMAIDAATSTAGLKAGANSVINYTFKGGMNFVDECLEVVTERYFRDEGESYTAATTADGLPKAIIDQGKWIHSLKLASAGADDPELPGVDELEELDILPGFSSHYAQWEMMRDLNLTDVTFEDYLRSEGVSVPAADTGVPQEDYKPELVRFSRDWTYPTNHIDPTNGVPASAVSWSIAERADKRRLFKEPGFLFGVSVVRPKVYLGNQKGAAVGAMDNIYRWLPAMLRGEEYTGLVETAFSATDGILQNQASNYWFDIADLLVFGDQFVNYAATVATGHVVALPTAALEKRYVADADISAMFKTATTAEFIRQDGRVSASLLSKVRQTT